MKEKKYMGMELRAVDNLIKRFIDRRMHCTKINRVTGSNGWIIGYLRDNTDRPIYQKDLEAEFKVTRSTTSKVLNLMEEKGFIERVSVPEDARLKRLVLTQKSMGMAEEMDHDRDLVEAQITKGFSEEELERFYSYIDRIKHNVSEG